MTCIIDQLCNLLVYQDKQSQRYVDVINSRRKIEKIYLPPLSAHHDIKTSGCCGSSSLSTSLVLQIGMQRECEEGDGCRAENKTTSNATTPSPSGILPVPAIRLQPVQPVQYIAEPASTVQLPTRTIRLQVPPAISTALSSSAAISCTLPSTLHAHTTAAADNDLANDDQQT